MVGRKSGSGTRVLLPRFLSSMIPHGNFECNEEFTLLPEIREKPTEHFYRCKAIGK
jgi:hypothetical protein